MIWHLAFLASSPPRLIEVQARTEDNLFWDVDCENILYPEPTGSRVINWREKYPRPSSVLESVCRESRNVVEHGWDWCFGDRHDGNLELVELDPVDETAKTVDSSKVEERLGSGFRRGIRFLSDRDTIHIKTGKNGIIQALKDARASTLDLGSIRRIALDAYLISHYLFHRQLFEGWSNDDGIVEEPMLKGLQELLVVMDNCPMDAYWTVRPAWMGIGGKMNLVGMKELSDEQLKQANQTIVEKLGGNKLGGNETLSVKAIRRSELVSYISRESERFLGK
ncbi:hypothetical protein CJF30_00011077 [Rutstroemia sp. NJR-2017a BBW]|nr:hypothetical protein CJF30_00011077 [Rutstroemia sp. NJR-2017a BBW]